MKKKERKEKKLYKPHLVTTSYSNMAKSRYKSLLIREKKKTVCKYVQLYTNTPNADLLHEQTSRMFFFFCFFLFITLFKTDDGFQKKKKKNKKNQVKNDVSINHVPIFFG